MAIVFLYVPTRDDAEARNIGRVLIEEKLAACINVIPTMHSAYRWNGSIEENDEALLLVKTTKAQSKKATARIEELHSYECPCIADLPIASINDRYGAWIESAMN
jgi:periplasmic divalent cation tolerance protein